MLLPRITQRYKDSQKNFQSEGNGAENTAPAGLSAPWGLPARTPCSLTLATFAAFLVPAHWFFGIYVDSMSYPKSFQELFTLLSLE